jgi:hypothetical protein
MGIEATQTVDTGFMGFGKRYPLLEPIALFRNLMVIKGVGFRGL